MSKVIDLMPRLKSAHNGTLNEIITSEPKNEVVNLEEKREVLLFQERRQVKRTILSEFVSSMVVLPEKGLLKVSIYDISEEGISFEMEPQYGEFKIDEEVSMRVYLNQKSYFPISVVIKHTQKDETDGLIRHGAEFLKVASTDAALQYFVRFIESVSRGLKKDEGDLMVPKIS